MIASAVPDGSPSAISIDKRGLQALGVLVLPGVVSGLGSDDEQPLDPFLAAERLEHGQADPGLAGTRHGEVRAVPKRQELGDVAPLERGEIPGPLRAEEPGNRTSLTASRRIR